MQGIIVGIILKGILGLSPMAPLGKLHKYSEGHFKRGPATKSDLQVDPKGLGF